MPMTVQDALGEQLNVLGDMHEVVSNLEARLLPVLHQDLSNSEQSSERPVPVTVMDKVTDNTRGAQIILARIQDIVGRLQI